MKVRDTLTWQTKWMLEVFEPAALRDMASKGMIPYFRGTNFHGAWNYDGKGSWPTLSDCILNDVERAIADIVYCSASHAFPAGLDKDSVKNTIPLWKDYFEEDIDKVLAMQIHERTFGIPVEFVHEGSDIRAVTDKSKIPTALAGNIDLVLALWGGSAAPKIPSDVAENVRSSAKRMRRNK